MYLGKNCAWSRLGVAASIGQSWKKHGLYTNQLSFKRYSRDSPRSLRIFNSWAFGFSCPGAGRGQRALVVSHRHRIAKRKYLNKLINGTWTSCFCMTEPSRGARSDPRAIKIIAIPICPESETFLFNKKWLLTGANKAGFGIIMAVVPYKGATNILTTMENPGINLVRTLDTMDSSFFGGHSVVELHDVKVSKEDVLGKIGKGLEYAQVRLAPARLTHCMRWLGAATRCHDEATK